MAADESAEAAPGLSLPALGDQPSPTALAERKGDTAYQKHLRTLRHTLIEALPAADWKKIIRCVVEIGTNGGGIDGRAYTPKDITGAAAFLKSLMLEDGDDDAGGSVPAQPIGEFTRAARRQQAQDDFLRVIQAAVLDERARSLSVHGVAPREVGSQVVADGG